MTNSECTCKMACDTCYHMRAETVDNETGGRMVDCDINERQMYAPMVSECKHYLASVDK